MSFTGVGTILRRGQGVGTIPAPGSDTFDVVGRVRQIGGPNVQKEEAEDTTLDAPGGYKQYLSGLRDPGNAEFGLSFEPGTTLSPANEHQEIFADVNLSTALSRRNWQIEWPDGTILDFQGEVFAASWNTEPNSPVDMNVTVRITGAVTATYP